MAVRREASKMMFSQDSRTGIDKPIPGALST